MNKFVQFGANGIHETANVCAAMPARGEGAEHGNRPANLYELRRANALFIPIPIEK